MATSITYAGYGVWNSVRDATSPVQQAYSSGTRTFFASNDWVGDPCPNKLKHLFIVWRYNGATYSGVVVEHDTIGIVLP